MDRIVSTVYLDIYDHDISPSTIKTISLDSQTRYVQAYLQKSGEIYNPDTSAIVTLTAIRPDKVGVEASGSIVLLEEAVYGEATEIEETLGSETISNAEIISPAVYGLEAEITQSMIAVPGIVLLQFKMEVNGEVLRTEIFRSNNGRALDGETSSWADEYHGYNLDEFAERIASVGNLREDLNAVSNGLDDEIARAQAEEARIEALFTGDVSEAVSDWLDDHPEATTTVQDGAITPIKLAPALATIIGDSALNFNTSRVTMLRNTICGDANHYLQGGTYVSSTRHFVIAFAPISGSGATSTILVELDTDFTTVIKRVSSANYGHANDLTYNPNTDKIYVSSTGQASGSMYERKVLVVNASTLTIESGIAFTNLVSAISYDSINNVYYTVESVDDTRKVFKYDANFNLLENIGDAFLIDPVRQVGQCSVCYNGRFYYVTVSNYRNHTVWINTFGSDAKIWQIDNFAYYEPEIVLEYSGSLYMLSIKSNTYIYIDRIGTDRTIYDRTEEYYLRGTLLITGANLNDVMNTGRYYMTEASASTIVNGPYTIMRQFSMDVLHIGYDGLCQIITVNNRMQFIRTLSNNTWTEWASLRSGRKYVGKTINTGNYYTAGFVTVAGRSIRFSIPMEIERDVNTASITGGSIRLLQGGNIVLDTSAILTTFDTVTVTVNELGVSCEFLFETAPENIIHNEAIGIQLYSMVIQFAQ